eukprot:scaffold39753_cov65-Phaeocystis_antarctica.AAC.11
MSAGGHLARQLQLQQAAKQQGRRALPDEEAGGGVALSPHLERGRACGQQPAAGQVFGADRIARACEHQHSRTRVEAEPQARELGQLVDGGWHLRPPQRPHKVARKLTRQDNGPPTLLGQLVQLLATMREDGVDRAQPDEAGDVLGRRQVEPARHGALVRVGDAHRRRLGPAGAPRAGRRFGVAVGAKNTWG